MSTEIRKVELPEKDLPLREDVSVLGSLVGEMLVDQHGPELLDLVERVRKASILNRENARDGVSDSSPAPGASRTTTEKLDEILQGLDEVEIKRLIHAFATYLRAVNLAEKVHRIRRRRAYQRGETRAQPGGLDAVIGELKDKGHDPQRIAATISALRIHPVFTAHPTEATRRTIQEKEYDIVLRLVERLNPELTPGEERLALQRIRAAITSAWQTRLEPHARTTVADELDNILFYLADILYRVVPVYYEALSQACDRHLQNPPAGLDRNTILRFGSWVGGDMDGNPNVTARTLLDTLAQQRRTVIRRYLPEVGRLARYLSQSLTEIGVTDEVLERIETYGGELAETDRDIPERDRDMPYRCLLHFVAARLSENLKGGPGAYRSAAEFARDVELIRDSLSENRGRHAGQFGVDRLLCRIRTFGFHLVTVDLRQDALLHRAVMGELLGIQDWPSRQPGERAALLAQKLADDRWPSLPEEDDLSAEAKEVLSVFRAIPRAIADFGSEALGMFIVSMTQGADDVLTVLAINHMVNRDNRPLLEVTPLLETVDDLQSGPAILEELLGYRVYREHLESLGRRQTIMIGYSDSNKDSGIVASRWALYQAQRALVSAGDARGIEIAFFHGRGGTVSRGGGNLVNGILGAPPRTVNGFLRMTEQGEVINQKYGVRFLALRNLELVSGATLVHSMSPEGAGLDREESELLSLMAEVSRRRFRDLVYGDPGFPAYFRAATPLDVIERLNIGSRPASRRSGQGIENLRAIPWVFSWAQTRIGFPGVFGFGSALDAAIERFGIEVLRDLLEARIFFRAMVNDVEMVLAKSELGLGRRYSGLAGDGHGAYFDTISSEFGLATQRILEIKQIDALLDDQRVLQRNIRLRNPYVDPLHLLQIDLLCRWREGGRQDDSLLEALKATVKGIALGIQNTG